MAEVRVAERDRKLNILSSKKGEAWELEQEGLQMAASLYGG